MDDKSQTTEALAQTIRLAYYTELCRKPPNSFVMREWGLLVTIERAPWLAAARAADAHFNPPPRLCDIDYVNAYHCRSEACRKSGSCTGARETATNAE